MADNIIPGLPDTDSEDDDLYESTAESDCSSSSFSEQLVLEYPPLYNCYDINILEKEISERFASNITQHAYSRKIIWSLFGASSNRISYFNLSHDYLPFAESLSILCYLYNSKCVSSKLSELRNFVSYFKIHSVCPTNYENRSFNLFGESPTNNSKCPFFTLTFQAFASGINFFISDVEFELHFFERKIKNIGFISILNYYSLFHSLVDKISFIYKLYLECTVLLYAEKVPTPLNAVKWLIDTLWRQMHLETVNNWSNDSFTSILSRLFLITILPQLNFISYWITHGIILDDHGEFFIRQYITYPKSMDLYFFWRQNCHLVFEDDNIVCPEMFRGLANNFFSAGKSLGPLKMLGISSSLFDYSNLCSRFVNKVCKMVQKKVISTNPNFDSTDKNLWVIDSIVPKIVSQQFISSAMLNCFRDNTLNRIVCENHDAQIWYTFAKLNPKIITEPLPLVFSNSLRDITVPLYYVSTKRLMSYLIKREDIFSKFHILHKIYLFGDSFIMGQFSEEIFNLYVINDLSRDPFYLTSRLNYLINSYLVSGDIKDIFIVSIVYKGSLSDVKIHYNSEPLSSIFFGQPILEIYQQIFSFLLMIKWTFWKLNLNSRYYAKKMHEVTPNILLLQQLTFYVSVLSQYFLQQVILKEYIIFKSFLIYQTYDVDDLVEAHEKYLLSIQSKCFLDEKHVIFRNLISELFIAINDFCIKLPNKEGSNDTFDIFNTINDLIKRIFTIIRIHSQLNFLAMSLDFNYFLSENVLAM